MTGEDPELCTAWLLELCDCPFIDECAWFVDGYVNQPRERCPCASDPLAACEDAS